MANTNVTTNYIPQIDYTSRDYVAIKNDLMALASQFNPGWTNLNEADLSVTLLELFAYLGDNLNFYIDRMANEGFLSTASQRDSILQLAAIIGYVPSTTNASSVTLTFTNTTASSATIPALTQVASSGVVNGLSTQIVFETNSALTISANSSSTVVATQGTTVTSEALGNSTGSPDQIFKLLQTGVITSSVTVYVGGIYYSYSQSLIDNGSYDSVFTTINDADGYTYVLFGDGINGRIPASSVAITATYRVGNGADGNVAANTISSQLTNTVSGVSVNNSADATGGSDAESNDSIRFNAPRALRASRRAVSLKDYGYLALNVAGVAKAIADATAFTSVTLYAAPFSDTGTATTNGKANGAANPITGISITATGGGAGTGGITYAIADTTGMAVGQYVTVAGVIPNSYDVIDALITAKTSTSFTIASVATGTFAASASSTAIAKTGNSTVFTALQTDVLAYFSDKVAPNVTLTITAPTYVNVNTEVTVNLLPQYSQTSISSQVNTALSNLVSIDNSFFADKLPSQFVLNAISTVAGVDYSTVEHLRFNKDEQIFAASSWYRTSGVVTINTLKKSGGDHNIIVGQKIRVSGIDASVDSTTPYVVTAVAASSISFVNGSGTSGSGGSPNAVSSTSNYVKVIQVDAISCSTNQILSKGTFTITTAGGTA
jgi:hypothetical protein